MVKGLDYPEWMNEESLTTLYKGYIENQTVKERFVTICDNFRSQLLNKHVFSNEEVEDYTKSLYEYLWNGWLCLSTPIMANYGTNKGLPISCYVSNVKDSTYDIYNGVTEAAMLSKFAGGVGIDFNAVRPSGSKISRGGYTEGIIPFLKVYDSAVIATNQAGTRRGSFSINLDITHGDWEDFIKIRKAEGDTNRQCVNLHHCTSIPDNFMLRLSETATKDKFKTLLKTRMDKGESYIFYTDNVNKTKAKWFSNRSCNATNICTETLPFITQEETFVCCLASLNLARYDDWKEPKVYEKLVFIANLFLDCILDNFINVAKDLPMFEKAVRFAENQRSIGIGVLGWHTYLQKINLPFISKESSKLTVEIFKWLKYYSEKSSKHLATILGEAPICKGYGFRNAQLRAIAPTTSNSIIQGGVSQGIEPIAANVYIQKTAKGTFIIINPQFRKLIETKYPEHNNDNLWLNINENAGSVQHLTFLDEYEKEIFLTAVEINQKRLVEQAAIRQEYIDQAQSLNLFFPSDVSAKWLWEVHVAAWELGIKTLYYVRSESILSSKLRNAFQSDCHFCEA